MTSRIGVNLLWLSPGVVGGSEQSTVASLRALAGVAHPDIDLRLFASRSLLAAHPALGTYDLDVLDLPLGSRPLRVAAESSWLARRTRGLDLVHHAGGTAPPVRSTPYVLTVHDLQPLEAAATHGPLKRAYLRAVVPGSVRRARSVVVPSDFVRRSVLEQVDVAPERVRVVPHGVSTWEAAPQQEVEAAYHLDGPVVLYPAITYPHKNHLTLVEAFARVLSDHADALLVLTGGTGAAEAEIAEAVGRLGVGARVRRPGRVPASHVAALYRCAAVVAVPSRYEGFGLPAAEAMAFGAPLVASAATSLPEVVGDGGVLVEPDDVEGWASAISGLLGDSTERERLGAAGLARAGRYTWAANAQGLLAAYRDAL